MDPEFKAFIDSLTPACAGLKRSVSKAPAGQSVTGSLKEIFMVLTTAFNEVAPYGCALRPMRRVKDAYVKCRIPKEVIGYHGLV